MGNFIDEVVGLYFKGYSVEESLKLVENEKKEKYLKEIAKQWDDKAKKTPVIDSRGWKYQQAKLI